MTGEGSLGATGVFLVEDLGVLTFLGAVGVLETVGESTLVAAAEDFGLEAKGEMLEEAVDEGLTDFEGRALMIRGVEGAVVLEVMATGERRTEGEAGADPLASAEVEVLDGEAKEAGS
jgi:hypothetical protein